MCEYDITEKGGLVKRITKIRIRRGKCGECNSELPFFMERYFCQLPRKHKGKHRIVFEWGDE